MNDVKHTHEDGPESAFFGTHTHDGFEHTHDEPEHDAPETEVEREEVEGVIHVGCEGDPAESSDSVEPPAPKRQVPVIISGVNHGMRDAEEGE